ncbi:MAG TPA: PIN domain-containing protein [Longimicrobium sp.]|nr:PIN domain-containing protein [Longimicrobium sp.]
MLTDAGPLIALINRNERHHASCLAVANRLKAEPLLTTWPCFAEAMHLVGRAGGHRFQRALWALWERGALELHEPTVAEIGRMAALMEKYRDTPMDLGDASLVATAESVGATRIFTLDGDFRVYRLASGAALEVVPS